jgi:molecular chaperone GrpE
MAEIDRAEDDHHGNEPGQGQEAAEGTLDALGDELRLEDIEGLAEEEKVKDAGLPDVAPLEPGLLLDAVRGLGDQLGRRLDLLQTTFERELRAEATRERVVDRLHAELQDYKQDFLLKVQRPIFIDLIQLHDDVGKMVEARSSSDADPDRAANLRGVLDSIQTAIEDILYRQGVEPFSLEGTEFDPRKQRAISTQVTDDPALNKRVAARLRKGFCSGEKLIRPEIVTVFTFRPPA